MPDLDGHFFMQGLPSDCGIHVSEAGHLDSRQYHPCKEHRELFMNLLHKSLGISVPPAYLLNNSVLLPGKCEHACSSEAQKGNVNIILWDISLRVFDH